MSKKNFSGNFNSLLGSTPAPPKVKAKEETKKKVGRPKDATKRVPTKSSQEGTKNNETRATFIVNEKILEELKNIAYWERTMIKEVVAEALNEYIEKYKTENGEIKQRSKK